MVQWQGEWILKTYTRIYPLGTTPKVSWMSVAFSDLLRAWRTWWQIWPPYCRLALELKRNAIFPNAVTMLDIETIVLWGGQCLLSISRELQLLISSSTDAWIFFFRWQSISSTSLSDQKRTGKYLEGTRRMYLCMTRSHYFVGSHSIYRFRIHWSFSVPHIQISCYFTTSTFVR